MKVIFEMTGVPFYLAHGGARTQIMNTAEALRSIGVEVEFGRWWDSAQQADLIHVFSIPHRAPLQFAREKKIPVVNTTLFTEQCNRSDSRLSLQGAIIRTISKLPSIPPVSTIRSQFRWDTFAMCDANIVGLECETEVLSRMYGVSREHIHIIPLGLDQRFIKTDEAAPPKDHLITTGTITERKGSLRLAQLAKDAGVPVCFIGKPYDAKGSYWRDFEALVDQKIVKHVSHTESVEEMIRLLRESRGFVLYSDHENWCFSAHEAAACGLPLLLPDQRWSRERFGSGASYFPARDRPAHANALKTFYDRCSSLPSPTVRHHTWIEIAEMHRDVYASVITRA